MKDNITVVALAKMMNVTKTTVDNWIARGILPTPLRVSQYRFWPIDDLPELLRRIEERPMWGKVRKAVSV